MAVNVLEFISSLAWPVVVLVVVLILRPTIIQALSGQLKKAKVGPVEVEWDRTLSEARHDLAGAGPRLADPRPARLHGGEAASENQVGLPTPAGLMAELSSLAEVDPGSAILETYDRIEQYLRALVEDARPGMSRGLSGAALAAAARDLGIINEEMFRVFQGLAVLRNLAAHGYVPDDRKHSQALEYIALADAAMFSAQRPRQPPSG